MPRGTFAGRIRGCRLSSSDDLASWLKMLSSHGPLASRGPHVALQRSLVKTMPARVPPEVPRRMVHTGSVEQSPDSPLLDMDGRRAGAMPRVSIPKRDLGRERDTLSISGSPDGPGIHRPESVRIFASF